MNQIQVQNITSRDAFMAFLESRSEHTIRAYRSDLADLAHFTGATDPITGLEKLLSFSFSEANHLINRWKGAMLDRKLSGNTIKRKLAAVSAFLKLCRRMGIVDWSLEVDKPRTKPFRNVSGPTLDEANSILNASKGNPRDYAVLMTLICCSFRNGEILGIEYPGDVDFQQSTLKIKRKCYIDKETLRVPSEVMDAIINYVAHKRGSDPGKLFQITGQTMINIIMRRAKEANVNRRITPHSFRHTGATYLLDNGVDIKEVSAFMGHSSTATTAIYADHHKDAGGKSRDRIAAALNL